MTEHNGEMATVEYTNVGRGYIGILEDILDSLDIRITRKEWKSKYNSYVVYDYEPFCADGFQINIQCSSPSYERLSFATYLYQERIKKIEALEDNKYIGAPMEQIRQEACAC